MTVDPLWLVFIGFAGGALGSMIGLGGGIIFVYVMAYLGSSPSVAASTSLFAVLSNAISATTWYSRHKMVDYSLGIKLGLLSMPGPILGATMSSGVTPDLFKVLFGILLVISAIYTILQKKVGARDKALSWRIGVLAVGTSFFAGIISAFFGVGGGIIFVPLLIVGMGMTMKQAAPTSQMILLFTATSGVIAHTLLGHPDFVQGAFLAMGAFAGALVGARLSLHVRERYLRILVSVVILAAATKLFLDSAAQSLSMVDIGQIL